MKIRMISATGRGNDNLSEAEYFPVDVLDEIAQTDSNVELMKIARREWAVGNELLAIKSAYKAAIHGYTEAQTFLGEAYELGTGVEKDDEEAVRWYTKAAIQMDLKALNCLAEYYYSGTVVKKDEILAEAMLLVSSKRKQSKQCLKKWYNVDVEKATTYCYHNSISDAVQRVEWFIESNKRLV